MPRTPRTPKEYTPIRQAYRGLGDDEKKAFIAKLTDFCGFAQENHCYAIIDRDPAKIPWPTLAFIAGMLEVSPDSLMTDQVLVNKIKHKAYIREDEAEYRPDSTATLQVVK